MSAYVIRKTAQRPEFKGLWDGPVWSQAETLSISHFHPNGSDHKPEVATRLLYDDQGIYVHFKVKDRYVRSIHSSHQQPVCKDSCVEFFFKPKSGPGYLNMEGNAGGTFLCSYIEDHRRIPGGFVKFQLIDKTWFDRMTVYHTLPPVVEPEITTPVDWNLEYVIPISLIEAYAGPLGSLAGQVWRANFYKCGDKTSHPHWGSWAPVGDPLNFHKPECFAPITFAP